MINDLLDPTGQNLRVREDAQVLCFYECSLILLIVILLSMRKCIIYWISYMLVYKCLYYVFQGTYVEGIKEEVVLSPGHALSFIAAGEGKLYI